MVKQKDLHTLRHSASHVLAQAVLTMFPEAKLGIGPVIEDGFYYDFDLPRTLIPEDLEILEKKMAEIIKANLEIKPEKLSKKKALEFLKKIKQPYKIELLKELSDKEVCFFRQGDFVDLCAGPHVKRTGEIKAFKLTKIAGAYWRGDEKNKMLQRIYGTAFYSQKELQKFLKLKEEAKKRDHKVLGKELEIFLISEKIGKGLPILLPKGRIIRGEILKYERELEKEIGFDYVWTPHIAKVDIYKKTGHFAHYKDMMFKPFGVEKEQYVLRPMNCPHHYMVYENKRRSYKDLPLRIAEDGTVYRFEKSGELQGLVRVRAFTIDDSHIFVTPEQIEKEYLKNVSLIKKMFLSFNLKSYRVRLSTWDPKDKKKYVADGKVWEKAEKALKKVLEDLKIIYEVGIGEAAFYGPKLDFLVEDALGREWQMSTLQLDFFIAEKLNLVYIDQKGKEKNPVIIHRGLTGSIERTIALLIEHFGGAFPLWLAPVQVIVLNVGKAHEKYALEVKEELAANNIRSEVDSENKTLGRKIRDAEMQKIPYILVVGDKEVKSKSVAVRKLKKGDLGSRKLNAFIKFLLEEIENKV